MQFSCKQFVLEFLISVILMGTFASGLTIQPIKAEPKTIVVPDDFATIQGAINNAVDGDTVFVKAGTYYEHVVVNKMLLLKGENRITTIVDGGGTGRVMNILHNNVSVTGFTVQRGQFGIYVQNSRYTNIFNNSITHNRGTEWDAGIRLDSSRYTVICSNNITDNGYGFWLDSSLTNTFQGNNISANSYDGFYLSPGSDSNIVYGNSISENNGIGINFDCSSSNTVHGNNITSNSYGIYVYSCSSNLIYHNNIVNNMDQVYLHLSIANVWDDGYPLGGNYWSDFSGSDCCNGPYQNVAGSDGVGDTPYVIDGNNRDDYPFMGQEGWQTHPIAVESNITMTDWTADSISLNFTVSGPTGKIGWVNASMPVGLNQTAIKIFIDNVELVPPPFPIITTNGTHYFIHFEFTLSTHNITIQYGKTSLAGDLNGDGTVDIFDIVIVAAEFGYGGSGNPPIIDTRADLNKDGTIDIFDIVIVAADFGKTSF